MDTTKTDLIEAFQLRYPTLKKKEAKEMVDSLFELISEILERGDKLSINDFGNFVVRNVHARVGRNPMTGLPITIPATKRVSFRPASALKKRVAK